MCEKHAFPVIKMSVFLLITTFLLIPFYLVGEELNSPEVLEKLRDHNRVMLCKAHENADNNRDSVRAPKELPEPVKVKLRSHPKTLNMDEIIDFTKKYNFYDIYENKEGCFVNQMRVFGHDVNTSTVVDCATGLTWKRENSDEPMTFDLASGEYLQKLNSEKYGGFDDWRLPNLEELSSLNADRDYIRRSWKTVKHVFALSKKGEVKTWSVDTPDCSTKECVSFFNSAKEKYKNISINKWIWLSTVPSIESYPVEDITDMTNQRNFALVLPVRSLSDDEYKRYCNPKQDKVVIDPNTSLMWQNTYSGGLNWEEAKQYCQDLELSGKTDWRLPAIEELSSTFSINDQLNHFYFYESVYWANTEAERSPEWLKSFSRSAQAISIRANKPRQSSYSANMFFFARCVRNVD